MPRIFDNIDQSLLPALIETLKISERSDFCVGYFNLRGWKEINKFIEKWSGHDEERCRLLVGMQSLPEQDLREALTITKREVSVDQKTALDLKRKLAEEFRKQLTFGFPTNEDEAGLRRLATQIKTRKVIVKLFLRYPLHAKLYLLFRPDANNPRTAFLGSSNLTFAGLSKQGELNVDVLDHDATNKLADWFNARWDDRLCVDISDELVQIIEESWARESVIPPYHIYLKMAYHLAQEARDGLTEFQIPKDFGKRLFDYQTAAVKISAHHLNKRGGVLIGDVVGLGKTLMATAIARIFEDDYGYRTLIICPKNLVKMWKDYCYVYGLKANVLSLAKAQNELPEMKRYNLLIIDESHNLRNREGKRFRAIQEYIQTNDSKVILLTATPYNKTYLDLSNQLRLFIPEEKDIGIRPETLLRNIGETNFIRQHQCPVRSLAAFEKSDYADDWRELMRLYLVRRTRSFIKQNYAYVDCPHCGTVLRATDNKCSNCGRNKTKTDKRYLLFEDKTKSFFPKRTPKKLEFTIDDKNQNDQYARLYDDTIVDIINSLELPRYGLGNYIDSTPKVTPSAVEQKQLDGLSLAGKRLMGFSRTNLFKRLESSGIAFIQSVERHILRNYVYLHAIENNLDLPIGSQDIEMLDPRFTDEDTDGLELFSAGESGELPDKDPMGQSEESFKQSAQVVYKNYTIHCKKRFKWIRSNLFKESLSADLEKDSKNLLKILKKCGKWSSKNDTKLKALYDILTKKHSKDKVLIFSQFADTVLYLENELKDRGIMRLSGATGNSSDPTTIAYRFSPVSNEKRNEVSEQDELRVLIATDVLSEGQNLQDCYVVINYDLPWAIIRLIQRAGRVDRIGQLNENILCYSFLPAKGVDKIIRLRARLKNRLKENAEVVGADEVFFEDDDAQKIVDLYNEKAGILDGDDDQEVDLSSYAFQIWNNAITNDQKLKNIIPHIQNVCYSTKSHKPENDKPEGVLVYMQTVEGNDALAWVNQQGESVTESQYLILKMAECLPNTPGLPRRDDHHTLVSKGVSLIASEERSVGGQLGSSRGVRFRAYERLKHYAEEIKGTLFDTPELNNVIQQIYRYPLKSTAVTTLNRQLRSSISDQTLAELVISLNQEDRLCVIHDEGQQQEPRIICSMGLKES